LKNNKTSEKLVVKVKANLSEERLLISRHPSKAAKRKIEEDEKEILKWDHYGGAKRICLDTSD
jgi:hypothetical protein